MSKKDKNLSSVREEMRKKISKEYKERFETLKEENRMLWEKNTSLPERLFDGFQERYGCRRFYQYCIKYCEKEFPKIRH